MKQQIRSCSSFPVNTQYNNLKVAFQNLLNLHLRRLDTYPFATKLEFNSLVLQKYELGYIGITPHRDRLSSINLICIFNIGGRGKFCLYADRSGNQAKTINSSLGSMAKSTWIYEFLRTPLSLCQRHPNNSVHIWLKTNTYLSVY